MGGVFRTPLDPLQFEDFVNSSFAQLTYTMSKMKGPCSQWANAQCEG